MIRVLSLTFVFTDNLFSNSIDLNLPGTVTPPLPTPQNFIGENDDFYIASQPITLEVSVFLLTSNFEFTNLVRVRGLQ